MHEGMYKFICFTPWLDDFPESTGVKRIVQALNANVWSNVVMKNGKYLGLNVLRSFPPTSYKVKIIWVYLEP